MSVDEHKHSAPTTPIAVTVLVVSTTRKPATDTSGARIVEALEAAGHQVLERRVVPDDEARIRDAVRALAREGRARAVLLTGGTGVSRTDRTPEAVEALFDRALPGFGELFRMLSFQEIGSAAMLSRATAGTVGALVVFAMPGSEAACALAVDKLILPELPHLVRELDKEGAAPATATPAAADEPVVDADFDVVDDEPALPEPSGTLGRLGSAGVREIGITGEQPASRPPPDDDALAATGWKRAVYEIGGEVVREKWEDLPFALEKLAPVLDVLHQAGERGVLRLPSGRKYSIFGYPDLRRPSSKVLAVGWGEPLGEVLALHRFPVQTGVCIDGDKGLLPSRSANVAEICEAVTGSVPADTSGELFAVQGDAVWIHRGRRVIRFDGRKERDDGNPKQVLASLVLHWSNR